MGGAGRHLSFANVASGLALFVALATGGAYAATELDKNEVKSKHIGKGQVKNADLADNSVTSPKVADGSLLDDDFAPGQLPAGAPGERGPQGPQGETGPAGSPDTPGQVLDKIKQVDGSGSGLDADSVDGLGASAFMAADAGNHTWQNLTFPTAGWGGSPGSAQCYKDALGIVHLRGRIPRTADTISHPVTVANMPQACSPAWGTFTLGTEVSSSALAQDDVGLFICCNSIAIEANAPPDNASLSIDTISYPAN